MFLIIYIIAPYLVYGFDKKYILNKLSILYTFFLK